MGRSKDNAIPRLLTLLLRILYAIQSSGVSALGNSVHQVTANQLNWRFHNAKPFFVNETNKITYAAWLVNFRNNSGSESVDNKIMNNPRIYKKRTAEIENLNGSTPIFEVQKRLWDCSYSFNDWCAFKISWLTEKRCTLLRQIKKILDLLKERKNLLSQLGYATKLVDITTYFVFMNDHISDVNEKLSKIVYSTSVFEAFEPDWASKAQEVIDKWSEYNAYY